jgi:diacylglycerol kinase (ATP)
MKNQSFVRRLGFALSGLATALRAESSFRTHVVAAVAVVAVLLWLQPAPLWWALVAVAVALVLAAELANTAVEHLADRLHPERHPDIKRVKDCMAGAVLVASLAALAVAAALLWDLLR